MSFRQWTNQLEKYVRQRHSVASADRSLKKPELKNLDEPVKKNEPTTTTVVAEKKLSFIAKFCIFLVITSILSATTFYYLPWEKLLFSDKELKEYIEAYGLQGDYANFLATADQHISQISLHEVECFNHAYWRERNFGAAPERCGTMLTDELLPQDQIFALRNLAIKVIDRVGDSSYANRESINLQWINLHNLFRRNLTRTVLNKKDYQLLINASEAAREAVAMAFGLPAEQLHFNLVTQFTRYRPLVRFSEFRHVDKVRSPALVVTSILWLSTCNVDFGGGHLEFLTGPGPEPWTPILVEPKQGRFAAWTSGFENPHGVNEVYWGNRYALIFAFTVSDKLGYKTISALRNWAINATLDQIPGSPNYASVKNGY